MQIYTVGGAVRDGLLGLPVQDRDHVVVGATPERMAALGYKPVGKDFPVFLHPETHEEYALARTERKTGAGYRGFAFHADADVTLEQDLARRDLTINAIARAADGSLIDPFGGRADLQARVFRHVSDAFAEDPVRILRIARFAARFTEFTVAPETNALMCAMVQAGEVDALVDERVWQELSRGLMERQPSRMFQVLRDCGALARILPELDAVWAADSGAAHAAGMSTVVARMVDLAACSAYPLPIRFAVLGLGDEPGDASDGAADTALAEALCRRLRVPNECRDLALMSARERRCAGDAAALTAEALVGLLTRCDAFRKPQRFLDMLNVQECAQRIRRPAPQSARKPIDVLRGALAAAQTVRAGEVAALYSATPERIPEAIHAARVGAVAGFRDKGAVP
ncbi:MAG: multifunctional addition/repair protein [Herbaspirillum sp.]|nr:multifunctional addition/repair protein [Herbaspirillum sp.]